MTACNTFFTRQSTDKTFPNAVGISKKDRAAEKISLLSRQIFPLTNAYTNSQGQKIKKLLSRENYAGFKKLSDERGCAKKPLKNEIGNER